MIDISEHGGIFGGRLGTELLPGGNAIKNISNTLERRLSLEKIPIGNHYIINEKMTARTSIFCFGFNANEINFQIYVNDVPTGVIKSHTSTDGISYLEDMSFSKGQKVQVWAWAPNGWNDINMVSFELQLDISSFTTVVV